MNLPRAPSSPAELLLEADARMTQALENFFQRSRTAIQDTIVQAMVAQMTPATIATGQTCLTWLNAHPETLSGTFADQFRLHLARPETFKLNHDSRPGELQLVDDDTLKRQLAEEKAAARLTEALRAEMLLLVSRLQSVRQAVPDAPFPADAYGPLPIVRALSRALDALGIDSPSGTFLLQSAADPLLDMLKHTYTALNQFLGTQDIPEYLVQVPAPSAPPPPRRIAGDAGQDVLAFIQAAARETRPAGPAGEFPAVSRRLIDSLSAWQASPPDSQQIQADISALVLRQLLLDARHAGARAYELAVLDAMASLFGFILDEPGLSPAYRAEIAHLQVPTLRMALVASDFFSDDQNLARRFIDLVGMFARRFPERDPSHAAALGQVQAARAAILLDPDHPAPAFAVAHDKLAAWLAAEDARTADDLAAEVARLEHIERHELGTLLAIENLRDLTERYPAPESVLQRLEAAWVPHMASLYVAESGEGPDWRAACLTLHQLFLSLQGPDSDAVRESRLQSIPHINTALRRGLLAQGAAPGQMKDFFSAITATQECWIRPAVGQREAVVSTFTPRNVSLEQIESLARRLAETPSIDPFLQQAQQLREGDWVDFDPPREGLSTARVAWVGVLGHLLFCDSSEQRFSLDCRRLAAEIRAGRASVPEQPLTRKAMLRLKTRMLTVPG